MYRLPVVLLVVVGLLFRGFCLPDPGDPVEAWDGKKVPTNSQLVKLLKTRIAGEGSLPIRIHEVQVYSSSPEQLTRPLARPTDSAPGTGDGKKGSWYFFNDPAPCKTLRGKGKARVVHESGEVIGRWHQERSQDLDIHGGDVELTKKSKVASRTTFSYKDKNRESTSWCMTQFSLKTEHDDGAGQKVLCLLYQSNRKNKKGSTASPANDGGDVPPQPPGRPSPLEGHTIGSHNSANKLPIQAVRKEVINYKEFPMEQRLRFTCYFDGTASHIDYGRIITSPMPVLSISYASSMNDLLQEDPRMGVGYEDIVMELEMHLSSNFFLDGKAVSVLLGPMPALSVNVTSTTKLHKKAKGKGKELSYDKIIMELELYHRKPGSNVSVTTSPVLSLSVSHSSTTNLSQEAEGNKVLHNVIIAERELHLSFTVFFDGKTGSVVSAHKAISRQAPFTGPTSSSNFLPKDLNGLERSNDVNDHEVSQQTSKAFNSGVKRKANDDNHVAGVHQRQIRTDTDPRDHPGETEAHSTGPAHEYEGDCTTVGVGVHPLLTGPMAGNIEEVPDIPPPFPAHVLASCHNEGHVVGECQATNCGLCMFDMITDTNMQYWDWDLDSSLLTDGPLSVSDYLEDDQPAPNEDNYNIREAEAGEQQGLNSSRSDVDDSTFSDNSEANQLLSLFGSKAT